MERRLRIRCETATSTSRLCGQSVKAALGRLKHRHHFQTSGNSPGRHTMAAVKIGVLALQGSFREHMTALRRLPGVEPVEVRTKEQLATVSGLIIPGASIADAPPPPLREAMNAC